MHSVACVGISGRFFTSFSRRCKLIITLRWWSPRMSFSIWELIYFCMQFSMYMSDWCLSVIKNQNLFWSLITGKNQFISFFHIKLFIIWRPPALPHRLQCSTIGRSGLNHRVRDGNGCVPWPHRHQKHWVILRECSLSLHPQFRFASFRATFNPSYTSRLPYALTEASFHRTSVIQSVHSLIDN